MKDNRNIIRAFIKKVWNEKKVELIPNYISKSYVAHKLGKGGDFKGREDVRLNVLDCHSKFINFKVTISKMVQEKNLISSWVVLHNGSKIMNEIVIHKIVNSRIAEAWSIGGNW